MFGIGEVNIKVEGAKNKEEARKQIMDQIGAEVDKMLDAKERAFNKAHKKEEVKEEKKENAYLHINLDEDKDRSGFGCSIDMGGDYTEVMTMLTVGVSEALHQIHNDGEEEFNPKALANFVNALIMEYIGVEEEEEDGE